MSPQASPNDSAICVESIHRWSRLGGGPRTVDPPGESSRFISLCMPERRRGTRLRGRQALVRLSRAEAVGRLKICLQRGDFGALVRAMAVL